jgi:surface-anchored protein
MLGTARTGRRVVKGVCTIRRLFLPERLKKLLAILVHTALITCAPTRAAEVFLSFEHIDILPTASYTNIAILNEDVFPAEQLEASNVVLVVGASAKRVIPGGLHPSFAPLGPAGSSVWILPQAQDFDLLFMGVAGYDLPASAEMRLLSHEAQCRGESHFLSYQTDLGTATFFMNTRDGVQATDAVEVVAGSHNHYNWVFTTNGVHRVTFQAVNTSLMLTSPPTTFLFHVLPLAPFESFQTNNWLSTAPLEIVSPTADPDGDGIPNLAEFAHATDPNHAGATNLPAYLLVNVTGTNYGAVRFTRNKAATDTVMTAEMAPAPGGPWSTMPHLVSVVDQGATELVTYRDVVPVSAATNRFGRVRVRWNP